MVTIKGDPTPIEYMSIINSIVDPQAKNIELKNISFYCESIKDALGNVFVKRKTGRWHTLRDASSKQEYLTCSKCTSRYSANAKYWNFCPNCGADMKGELNETDVFKVWV